MIITTERKRKRIGEMAVKENRYKFRKTSFKRLCLFAIFVVVDGPYCMSKASSIIASVQQRVREMGYAW